MKKILGSYIAIGFMLSFYPNEAGSAQVLPSFSQNIPSSIPCGTGCATSQQQLSEIVTMKNGLRRVLVERQILAWSNSKSKYLPCTSSSTARQCGGDTRPKRYWMLAKCNGRARVNMSAYRSDGTDGNWKPVFDSKGKPLFGTAYGDVHTNWAALCD